MKEVVRNICLLGTSKHIEPVTPSAILGKGILLTDLGWLSNWQWTKMWEPRREALFLPQNPEVPSPEPWSAFLRTLRCLLCWPLMLVGPLPSPFSLPFSADLLWLGLLCFKVISHLQSNHNSKFVYQLPVSLFPLDVKDSRFEQEVWLFPTSRFALALLFMTSFCSDNDLEVVGSFLPSFVVSDPLKSTTFQNIFTTSTSTRMLSLYKPLPSHPKTSSAF